MHGICIEFIEKAAKIITDKEFIKFSPRALPLKRIPVRKATSGRTPLMDIHFTVRDIIISIKIYPRTFPNTMQSMG